MKAREYHEQRPDKVFHSSDLDTGIDYSGFSCAINGN